MDLETVINSFHADIDKLCFEKLLPYFSTKNNKKAKRVTLIHANTDV